MIAIRKIIERLATAAETVRIAKSPSTIQPLLVREDDGVFIGIPMLIYSKTPNMLENTKQYLFLLTLDAGERKDGNWYHSISDLAPFNIDSQLQTIMPTVSESYDREEYDGMYSTFDSIRQSLLEGVPESQYVLKYGNYVSELIASVHPSLRHFYESLIAKYGLNSEPPAQPQKSKDKNASEDEGAYETAPAAQVVKEGPSAENKTFTAGELTWKPINTLSTLPEPLYNLYRRIAKHVDLLESSDQSTPRIAYPLFCFAKDRKEAGDMWHELLKRAPDLKKGHIRVSSASIYTKCGLAEKTGNCMFGYCPYVVAAYIKYLETYHPEKLKSERDRYRKDRFRWDAKFLGKPEYEVKAPGSISADALSIGLKLIDTGMFAVYAVGERVDIAWFETDDNGGLVEHKHMIDKGQLIKEYDGKWELVDVYGNAVPNDIAYAVLADYSLRTGTAKALIAPPQPAKPAAPSAHISEEDEGIEETVPIPSTERKKTEGPKLAAQEPARPQEAVIEPTREKVSNTAAQNENPKAAPASERQKSIAEQEPAYSGRLSPKSTAYRCLADKGVDEFYGMLITFDAAKDEIYTDEIFKLLEKKGYTKRETLSAQKYTGTDLREHVMYVVDIAFPPTDMTGFKRFKKNTAVLLRGTTAVLKGLYDDPFLKSIYGACTIKGTQRSVGRLNEELWSRLSENMRPATKEQGQRNLSAWLKTHTTPVNEDGLCEYLYWLCFTAGEWAFDESPDNKGGNNTDA